MPTSAEHEKIINNKNRKWSRQDAIDKKMNAIPLLLRLLTMANPPFFMDLV